MRRSPGRLTDKEYDLVVVGGGAFGCAAAWEGASRGLKVALVERGDFCGATSANHLKVVHGGIRYLQHLDVRRVRESMKERRALLRIAPHLVRPLPIVMPTHGRGTEGRFVLRSGLALYDLLTLDRNRGIPDPARRIPPGRMLSRTECLEHYPWLETDELTGAGLFYDAQFVNPPRLAWAFLRSAVGAGAAIANYIEVTRFLTAGDRIVGVAALDRLSGESIEIRGRMVLNAAGPWAIRLVRESLGLEVAEPTFSRDAGFVVRGRRTGDLALACRIGTRDPDAVVSRQGRHIFIVPWRDHTLIGVWHRVHQDGPDDVGVDESELESWIGDVNGTYPALELARDDVTMVYSGLTLFADENDPDAEDLRFGKRSILADHRLQGVEGLVTLVGIRATMARGVAEQAVDLILAKLGTPSPPSRTAEERLWGGGFESFESLVDGLVDRHGARYEEATLRALAHAQGTKAEEILAMAAERPELGTSVGGSHVLLAEVVHAVWEEMAVKLGDVVFRRTELASGSDPGAPALESCATTMASELGWDEIRVEEEIREVQSRFRSR